MSHWLVLSVPSFWPGTNQYPFIGQRVGGLATPASR